MGNTPNVGTKRGILFLLESAHNIDSRTNDKVIKHTYFWSFGIHSVAPTLLDVALIPLTVQVVGPSLEAHLCCFCWLQL
jgi:hypothetical protein